MLLPALCLLIPVVGWMVTVGWALKVTRNVIDGVESPPEHRLWHDILRGFFAFLISFVYSLPVTLITSIGAGLTAGKCSITTWLCGVTASSLVCSG